ncbi:MAG: cyclic nucleotide-binding/CBS domain-containing protein [Candidatus Pacearchaeota archaeon]
METGYKIGEIMVRDVHTTFQGDIITLAARKMAQEKIGCLVITDDKERVVGILTEQDIARKVVAEGRQAEATLVKEIMSREIIHLEPHEDLHKAVELMGQNNIKHLPVISKGKLQGILTFKDIIALEPALIESMSFKNNLKNLER